MHEYRLDQVSLSLDETLPAGEEPLERLKLRAARSIMCRPDELEGFAIEKKSVDARDKRDIRMVYRVRFALEKHPKKHFKDLHALAGEARWSLPARLRRFNRPPLVVGAGPAGLFAALALAEAGARPILLERGDPVERRREKVAAFMAGGPLDPDSNIQFGEGGAGTWSDGKLTTQVKDRDGRRGKVLDELIRAGAPQEIAWLAKPHLGTDRLEGIVRGLRERIEALGGQVLFQSRVCDIATSGQRLSGLLLQDGSIIDCEAAILAPGHSARELFTVLERHRVAMEAKPFAIGLRVEHPQELISRNQYGESWTHPALGPAEYRLAAKSSDGRGVYSFCMCPGGTVVNASSEAGHLVCNGMSRWLRDGKNANAAIVVAVDPVDFGTPGSLGGIAFQRHWESKAFTAAQGALPVQRFEDFVNDRASTALGRIQPDASGPWGLANLVPCLPPAVYKAIGEGMEQFKRQIQGYAGKDVVMTAVETRTSSPVRILRNLRGESSLAGLFVAGEGPGYAGGIMSAAMDGLTVARALLEGENSK